MGGGEGWRRRVEEKGVGEGWRMYESSRSVLDGFTRSLQTFLPNSIYKQGQKVSNLELSTC